MFFVQNELELSQSLDSIGADSGWWSDTAWDYAKKITIDNTKVDATLTNFPILVQIREDTDLHSHAQDDGDDILFTLDGNNETKLNHEIEYYNNDSNYVNASIWVNITSLSSSADTVIWMYYGNSGCASQESIIDTWDSNYVMVQHLNESTGTVYDSTSNDNDGTSNGNPSYEQTGVVGYGITFDGSGDWFDCGDVQTGSKTAGTLSYWLYMDTGIGETEYIVGLQTNGASAGRYGFATAFYPTYGVHTTMFANFVNEFVSTANQASKTLVDDNYFGDESWAYITMTFNNDIDNNIDMWVNDSMPTQIVDRSAADAIRDGGTFSIGRDEGDTSRDFTGSLDEIRFTLGADRNSSWIKADFNTQNQTTGFLTIGSELELGVGWSNTIPTKNLDLPGNGATGISLQPVCQIDVNDVNAANQSINVTWQFNDSGTWYNFGYNQSASNMSDIKQTLTNASVVDTTYQWRAVVKDNATPSGYATNVTWSFTTLDNDPVINTTTISPSNGSTTASTSPTLSVYVSDVDDATQDMNITWYEGNYTSLTEVDNWDDINANQGVCANDTYIWTTNATNIYKIWKSNGTQQINHDTTGDGTYGSHLGDLCLHGGYIYIATCNFPTNKESSINKYYANNLTYITEYLIADEPEIADGVAYNNGSFWVLFSANNVKTIRRYNSDFSDYGNNNYTLSYSITGDDTEYEGLTWYGEDLFVPVHDGQTPALAVDRYHWNGAGFEEVKRYLTGYVPTDCNQGIDYYDGYFYLAQRDHPSNDQDSVVKCELTGWHEVQQNNSVNNGTYYYDFTNASGYNFTYYWKVNVSDGHSGYDQEIFHFTTVATNVAPTVDYKTPINGTTGVAISGGVTCYAYTNDTDGDTLNITWATNESGSWVNKYTNTSEPANGTESYTFTDFDTGSTTYWWKVFVNDGTENISEIYHFTTLWSNTCPVSSGLTISNGSCCNALNLSWNITINDADGNTTSGTIFNSDGQNISWSVQANGTRSLSLVNLTCETNYTIWVNYTDTLGVCSINESYWFVTEDCPESGVCNCSDFFNETELYDWLNASGFMDMSDFMINPVMMAIVLMLTFFVLAERKEDYLLYVLSGVLALVMGVYYIILLEGISYVSWIGVILLLFGVYCFFLSLAYSLKKRSRK